MTEPATTQKNAAPSDGVVSALTPADSVQTPPLALDDAPAPPTRTDAGALVAPARRTPGGRPRQGRPGDPATHTDRRALDPSPGEAGGGSGGGRVAPFQPVEARHAWQAAAEVRRRELARELMVLCTRAPSDRAVAISGDVAEDFRDQLQYIRSKIDPSGPDGKHIVEWWTGSRIETVWQQMHSVERGLVDYRSTDDLRGALPGMVTSAQRFLPKSTRSVDQAVKWIKTPPPQSAELRSGIRTLLEESHGASDAYYAGIRTLRNRLFVLCVAAFGAAVLLVGAQLLLGEVSLIAMPDGFGGEAWLLMVLVLVAGALGAFVTGLVPMLKSSGGGHLPYKLPFLQGLLKIAVGPVAAVAGVIFVVGGLTGTTPSGIPQLVAIAVVFGSAQQALTGFADRNAAELLAKKENPSAS